jgi:hypothetical protein
MNRVCTLPGCKKKLIGKRSDTLYCTDAHKAKAHRIKAKAQREVEAGENPEKVVARPVGISIGIFEEIERLLSEGHTISEVSRITGENKSVVFKAKVRLEATQTAADLNDNWEMSSDVYRVLAHDLKEPDPRNYEESMDWAIAAADRFLEFEALFIPLGKGKPYIRKPFHRRWIIETLFAIVTGGYLQIMAPPRHGKSELMRNFSVWIICRFPDARILWVGSNEQKSVEQVKAIRDILESHRTLRLAVLGPTKSFRGNEWASGRFTVDNRTTVLTGSTMLAIGRGGKMLSLNADIIFVDDIEDYESTSLPHQRRKTRRWYGQDLDSRKEEHTAMVIIGSRQHFDDFYGYNLDDPNFRFITDSAHNLSCSLDPFINSLHVDCMLFPEVRSYRWLMSKKTGSEARDEEGIFEMVYLNDPHDETLQIFVASVIRPSFNATRGIGLENIPERGRKLVAGLDPSATGYQAGFLWAVTASGIKLKPIEIQGPGGTMMPVPGADMMRVQDAKLRRWMVDIDNRVGGGIEAALELMQRWLLKYDCRHWVIEENLFHGSIRKDPRVRYFVKMNEIHMEQIDTQGTNKHDPSYGVGAMKRLFTSQIVDLPYGTDEARTKTNMYAKEMYSFTDDATLQAKRKANILMASWFPQKVIRRWEKEAIAERTRVVPISSPYPSSFSGVQGFTRNNVAPWRS